MKRLQAIFLLALAMLTVAPLAQAQSTEKISVRDSLSLLAALRNLDGKPTVVKDQVIVQPWEFKSGVIRLRIANNIAILSAVEKLTEQARVAIVMQVRKKYDIEKIEAHPTALEEFSKLYDQVLSEPAAGTQDLARVKTSDLRLDVNEIGVTVLSAMTPILEQDVR